ncbi:MAG: glutamate synthase-related protein, partial [Anaerolineales bacterium]
QLTPPVIGALVEAAATVQTCALMPYALTHHGAQESRAVIPIVRPEDEKDLLRSKGSHDLIELEGWDRSAASGLRRRLAPALVMVRLSFGTDLMEWVADGFRLFHLTADYHGRTAKGFVMDSIREAHDLLVRAGVREQVTLVGAGGVIAAEHVAKAIISGLDAVALDTPLWVALQGKLVGECTEEAGARVEMPALDSRWAVQRLANLSAAWRDQLLEVLGAMGMRDVRRLRGEVGRAMLQEDLELEAFAGIEGYDVGA